MSTISIIAEVVLVVAAFCIGAGLEGGLVRKSWQKKVSNLQHDICALEGKLQDSISCRDIQERLIGKQSSIIQQLKDLRELDRQVIDNLRGNKTVHADIIGQTIVEPSEVPYDDYRDTGYHQWLIEHPEMGDEYYPQEPGEAEKYQKEWETKQVQQYTKDMDKYSSGTGHQDDRRTPGQHQP